MDAEIPADVRSSASETGSEPLDVGESEDESSDMCERLCLFHENLGKFEGSHDIGDVEPADVNDSVFCEMFLQGVPLLMLQILCRVRHVVIGLPRLHLVELFAGKGAITRSFMFHSFRTVPIDLLYHEEFDITSTFGFLICATLVLRLARFIGLLWMAPVCSTFVWLGRSKFKRSVCWPEGDIRRADVVRGNTLCNRCLALACISDSRLLQWCLEQPLSSVMGHMRRFQRRLARKPSIRARVYWLCDFGADTAKPVRYLSSSSVL